MAHVIVGLIPLDRRMIERLKGDVLNWKGQNWGISAHDPKALYFDISYRISRVRLAITLSGDVTSNAAPSTLPTLTVASFDFGSCLRMLRLALSNGLLMSSNTQHWQSWYQRDDVTASETAASALACWRRHFFFVRVRVCHWGARSSATTRGKLDVRVSSNLTSTAGDFFGIPRYGTSLDTPTPDAAIENATVVKETP